MPRVSHMRRRRFLSGCGHGLAGMLAARAGVPLASLGATFRGREVGADVVIVGGGLGGCAAALAALRNGRTVVMTELTDWVGGQLTQQAVPPDEHPWIEQFGGNASYFKLRQGIRDDYRRHYPLTAEALADPRLNPGNGGVSKLCHEPRVALAVLTAMLAPYASGGRLTLLLEHEPVKAETQGDRVRSVTVQDRKSRDERTLVAPYILDATELGDLLPLAGVEFVTGFEAKSETGDRNAPEVAQPDNQQSFTCCFAMDYLEGQDHTIDRPAEYDFWRDYVPKLTPAWPGKLLGTEATHPVTLQGRPLDFDPRGAGKGFWLYRRIADPKNFRAGAYAGGMTLVNWPQNDYWLGNLIGVTPDEAARHVARAKQLSLSLLYWMQTEYPRPDGKLGWKGLRLRPDIDENGRRPRQVPVHPRVAPHPGRVHRRGKTRRHRRPPPGARARGRDGRALRRLGRRRQLPDRPAPEQRRRQLHRRQLLALPDPARGAHPPPRREPDPRVQEPGRHPRHQRLLPAAPRRVGDRRSRRRVPGRVLLLKPISPQGPSASTPPRLTKEFQTHLTAARSGNRLAEADAEVKAGKSSTDDTDEQKIINRMFKFHIYYLSFIPCVICG